MKPYSSYLFTRLGPKCPSDKSRLRGVTNSSASTVPDPSASILGSFAEGSGLRDVSLSHKPLKP